MWKSPIRNVKHIRALNVLQVAWRTIPEEEIQERFPNRAQDMLKNKGGHTKFRFSGLLE